MIGDDMDSLGFKMLQAISTYFIYLQCFPPVLFAGPQGCCRASEPRQCNSCAATPTRLTLHIPWWTGVENEDESVCSCSFVHNSKHPTGIHCQSLAQHISLNNLRHRNLACRASKSHSHRPRFQKNIRTMEIKHQTRSIKTHECNT